MHISEINVLGYLQRVATLKVLMMTILEMTMLLLLPKVPTTIESRLLKSYLQKVIHQIHHMHKKTYENLYVWSD